MFGGTSAFLTSLVTLLVVGNYSKESCLGRVYETAYDLASHFFFPPTYIDVGKKKKKTFIPSRDTGTA